MQFSTALSGALDAEGTKEFRKGLEKNQNSCKKTVKVHETQYLLCTHWFGKSGNVRSEEEMP